MHGYAGEKEKMKKYAWTWNVKTEWIDAYVKMHQNPWPEVLKAHSEAGIANYSIFKNGKQFFYVFECEDVDKAMKYLDQNQDARRWNALTSKMVEVSFDLAEDVPIQYMEEIFRLE
jgi:L-rhamnose mutarotase